ncbi:MAG: bifunctional 2-polyprenyl-6-hydroxyphenol methylase/3-demethylubiquinol 3-O-methyltransferase UbiG [Alphaproteobacteria bacterium]
MSNTVDEKEIQAFSKDADHWWDPEGPFKPLHKLNPVRMGYIKDQICAHFGRDSAPLKSLEGLEIIDIGCGGGLVCEPLARMGATVTGADADAVAIEMAKDHAHNAGLDITYVNKPAENIQDQFDVVLALEIIEHVSDPQAFVENCARLCKPGGLIIFSTLNRTPKSYALGIVAAEYILRWVPQGTHSWKKFVKPSELARYARQACIKPQKTSGLIFNPLKNGFSISSTDIDVNYFMVCTKP